ncbi:glycosyltransferase [Microbacterium tumbae]
MVEAMDSGTDAGETAVSEDPLATLAVLVVNYGSHEIVEANLAKSLSDGFAGQVIVVDNFSTAAERSAIAAACERHGWDLLALPRNEGFGGGNNRAAARAIENGATELLLVNPDASLSPETIRALQAQVREDRGLQLAPTVLRPNGALYTAEVDLHLGIGEMRGRGRRPAGTDPDSIHTWVSGACFAISTELWERIGGFDDDYFLYWEDVDLSRRVVDAGGTVRADPTLRAVHDEGATHRSSGAGQAKSPIYYYYNARNRLLYAAKHLGPADRRRWLRTTPRASYRILLQGGRRQFIHPLRTFWPALRGSLHGIRLLRAAERAGSAASPADAERPDRPALRVMQSFGAPLPTTNPYITMLDEALAGADGVEHLRFSWPTALFGRYDAFQWHWPEAKLQGTTRGKSAGKYLLTWLLSLRHSLSRRIAVVRTVHNIELPDDTPARLRLLRRIERQTDYRIALNTTTPLREDQPHSLILHGHYRDWYGRHPQAERIRGRLGTFGGVRRYKGVNSLIDAYADAVGIEPSLSLRVGGKPSTPELADDLRERTSHLPGVSLQLAFLSDAELVELATSSELVVLAYRFMHNSGSALAALSLDRPVLVPRNAPNEALAAEVGAEWVLMYDGELDGTTLADAWRAASVRSGAPDLSRREWTDTGAAHAEAFRAAVAVKRRRRTSRAAEGR